MLTFSAKLFAVAAFLAVVIFLGLILWNALFPTSHPVENTALTNQLETQGSTEKEPVISSKLSSDDRIARYTLALALFTAMLVLVAAYQIGFLISANETAERDAAKDAANAAGDSVNLARDNSICQLRAYIFLDNDVIDNNNLRFATGDVPSGMFRLKNFGTTPANDLVVQISSGVGPWPLPEDTKLPLPAQTKGTQIAPPGAVTLWPLEPKGSPVAAEDFEQIKADRKRFYVWGRASYSDVFGKDRFTNFCLAVVPPTDPRSGAGYGLIRCPIHNDYN